MGWEGGLNFNLSITYLVPLKTSSALRGLSRSHFININEVWYIYVYIYIYNVYICTYL